MTKKDFEFMAGVIKRLPMSLADISTVANEFADACEQVNGRFDRDRFLKACSPIGTDYSKRVA